MGNQVQNPEPEGGGWAMALQMVTSDFVLVIAIAQLADFEAYKS